MTETFVTPNPPETTKKAPAKKRPKRRKPAASAQPRPVNELAGITSTKCPTACTSERCVISTVGVCKHPMLAPASGCGPVTLANRAKALKMIKRKAIDAN